MLTGFKAQALRLPYYVRWMVYQDDSNLDEIYLDSQILDLISWKLFAGAV